MIFVGYGIRNFSLLSGVSRYVAELAKRLPARGFEALIAANRLPVSGADGLHAEKVLMLPFTSGMRAASFDRFARRNLSRRGARLLHGHGDLARQDVLSVHNCDAAAAHYVPDGRRPSAGTAAMRKAQFSPAGARTILANSDMVRRDLSEFYGIPPERVRRLYLGVDLERFHPRLRAAARPALLRRANWPNEMKIALAVLSGDPAKRNFSLLAEAVELLSRKEPFGLCVVGRSGWEFSPAARRLQAAGRLIAVEPTTRVEDFYAAADIFVLAAHYEEFGMTVLEALASGCPVVVGGRCGAAEILGPLNGFIVRSEDRSEWAENIRLAAGFGAGNRNCRETAESFSWDRHADELVKIYRELL